MLLSEIVKAVNDDPLKVEFLKMGK